MDVKKIGRIPDGGGWRAHGRASRSITRDRDTLVGFDHVHSLIDDCSRLAYSEVTAPCKPSFAYHQAFTSNTTRIAALAPWIEHYNTARRHSALGGLPPTSRLQPTS